ncbi:MAG TPA: efflux RND transporter periplasmic adaptor subunit [Bacteroidia bacterium]|nr:efflux RND transporter periplasmic adaptor subunit [Bacteroidia bacterium]
MKQIPNWLRFVVIVAVLLLVKFLFLTKKEAGPASPSNSQKSPQVVVNYCIAKKQAFVNRIFCAGETGAFNQVDILPEIAGKVVHIYFKEGDRVNKGDLLLKLNDADLQAQLLKVKTQLKLAVQKLERLNKLREIKGVSEEEYDMQQNEIEVLKADQAFYEAQIAKTAITAPFDGFTGLKKISEGAFVNSGTAIVSLVQLKPLYVEFAVPGKYSSELRSGMNLEFEMENALSAKAYSAKVFAIEPRMDQVTKTVKVRALYDGNETVLPGSYAKVFLDLGVSENVVMVPSQCLIPVLKGHKVFITQAGVAVERMVKIGPRNDKNVVILDGIAEGDTVISSGLMSVKKDSKLKLIQSAD